MERKKKIESDKNPKFCRRSLSRFLGGKKILNKELWPRMSKEHEKNVMLWCKANKTV